MGRVQNSQQHVIVNSIGSELPAHIPPAIDGAIDGLALGVGEWFASRKAWLKFRLINCVRHGVAPVENIQELASNQLQWVIWPVF